MDQFTQNYVDGFMADLIAKNPGEKEFHQAVKEVLESVAPYIVEHPYLMDQKILERIVEPERIIIFRVPWVDDEGEVRVNRGYRVQCNSAIGPYKGGIRFHPSVNLSLLSAQVHSPQEHTMMSLKWLKNSRSARISCI